jgi:hypothetical protein
VMVWVYYSAQIFLLGAEFTWVYAHESGSRRGESVEKENLAEAKAPSAPAVHPVTVMPAAPVVVASRRVPILKRKSVFGVTVAAAFLCGAVLRRVIVDR